MSKKTSANKNGAVNKAKDYVTNKLLVVFTIAFVMIIALMNISRMMRRVDSYLVAMNGVKVFAAIMLGVTVLVTIYAIIMKIRGVDTRYCLMSGRNIAIVSAFITLCFGALALAFRDDVMQVLYVFIPAVTVLYIVYYSYPRDFFTICSTCVFGAIVIWMIGTAFTGGAGESKIWLLATIMFILLALLFVFTILMQAKKGKLLRSNKEIVLYSADTKYSLLYVTYVLVAVLLGATILLAGAMFYYFIFAIIGYIVFTGIYYTIKLI